MRHLSIPGAQRWHPKNAGYSSDPWTFTKGFTSATWNCETFVQNQNANAIRFGTLYNFRFDSTAPPAETTANIGFFKTGSPISVKVQAPAQSDATPTARPSPRRQQRQSQLLRANTDADAYTYSSRQLRRCALLPRPGRIRYPGNAQRRIRAREERSLVRDGPSMPAPCRRNALSSTRWQKLLRLCRLIICTFGDCSCHRSEPDWQFRGSRSTVAMRRL